MIGEESDTNERQIGQSCFVGERRQGSVHREVPEEAEVLAPAKKREEMNFQRMKRKVGLPLDVLWT
jgi:hypothetical protein